MGGGPRPAGTAGRPLGLGPASARGSGYLLLSTAATAGFQLVSAGVLGRLLSPGDFGVMATATLLLRVVHYFSQFGIGNAIVQKPDLTTADVRTASAVAMTIGAAAAVAAAALAHPLGTFFGQPAAVPLAQVLSVSFLVVGAGTTSLALLRRRLRFGAVAIVETTSYAVGYLGIGVTTAVALGWGVWSLVAAALTQTSLQALAGYLLVRHPVGLRWRAASAGPLLRFGGQVSVAGFVEFWSLQIDTIGVARSQAAAGLGQYTRAGVVVTPVMQAAMAVTRVLSSSFARLDGGDRVTAAYRDSLAPLATGCLVAAGTLAGAHHAVVLGLLGPQWTAAAALLPWLAAATALLSLSLLPAALCEARGLLRPKIAIHLAVLAVLVAGVGPAVATRADLWVFAAAWTLAELTRLALFVALVARSFSIPLCDQLVAYGQAAAVAAAAWGAAAATQAALGGVAPSVALQAVAALLAGPLVAVAVLAAWPGCRLRQAVRRRRLLSLVVGEGRRRRILARLLG